MVRLTQTLTYSLATYFSLKINHHQARYTVSEKQVQNSVHNTSSFLGGSPNFVCLFEVGVCIVR